MGIAPARIGLAAALVVALLAAAVAWNVRSSQPGAPVSARESEAVSQQAAVAPEVTANFVVAGETKPDRTVSAEASVVQPAEVPSETASKALNAPSNDAAPAPDMKQAAQQQDLRGGLHIGGHSRLMDSFIGVVDVDESDVAKTINVHILQDEEFRYYFELDSQTVPAGEKVMFVVNNTHFTPDECW